MEVNEITIVTNYDFTIAEIVDTIIEIFKLNINKINCNEISDWSFSEIISCDYHEYELSDLACKIINVEIFSEINKPNVIYIYKENGQYIININFSNNVVNVINNDIIEKIITMVNNNFIIIAFGDEFLINDFNNINTMLETAAGVEFWVINKHQDDIDYEIIYNYSNGQRLKL